MSKVLDQSKLNQDKAELRDLLGDKPNVYTILRSVSASGMTRHISLKTIHRGELIDITYLASRVMGDKLSERLGHNTIRVNGCGMDMGWHLVYNLSSILYAGADRAGYVINQRWI
jgi:hypothetical protein